jgi:hypothetical protein
MQRPSSREWLDPSIILEGAPRPGGSYWTQEARAALMNSPGMTNEMLREIVRKEHAILYPSPQAVQAALEAEEAKKKEEQIAREKEYNAYAKKWSEEEDRKREEEFKREKGQAREEMKEGEQKQSVQDKLQIIEMKAKAAFLAKEAAASDLTMTISEHYQSFLCNMGLSSDEVDVLSPSDVSDSISNSQGNDQTANFSTPLQNHSMFTISLAYDSERQDVSLSESVPNNLLT